MDLLSVSLIRVNREPNSAGFSVLKRLKKRLFSYLITGEVVYDLHFSVLVDPELSNDDVVHDGLDFSPGVVVPVGKLQVSDAQRLDLQVLALEPGAHGELLPTLPTTRNHFTVTPSFRLQD